MQRVRRMRRGRVYVTRLRPEGSRAGAASFHVSAITYDLEKLAYHAQVVLLAVDSLLELLHVLRNKVNLVFIELARIRTRLRQAGATYLLDKVARADVDNDLVWIAQVTRHVQRRCKRQ